MDIKQRLLTDKLEEHEPSGGRVSMDKQSGLLHRIEV